MINFMFILIYIIIKFMNFVKSHPKMNKFRVLKNNIIQSKRPSQQLDKNLTSITSSNYKIKQMKSHFSSDSDNLTFRQEFFEQCDDNNQNNNTVKIKPNMLSNISPNMLTHQIKQTSHELIQKILQNLRYLQENYGLQGITHQVKLILISAISAQTLSQSQSYQNSQQQINNSCLNSSQSLKNKSQIANTSSIFMENNSNLHATSTKQHNQDILCDFSQQRSSQNQFDDDDNRYKSELCVISEKYESEQSDLNSPHDSLQYKKILYILEGSSRKLPNNNYYEHSEFGQKTDDSLKENLSNKNNQINLATTYSGDSSRSATSGQCLNNTQFQKNGENTKRKILNDAIHLLKNKYNKKVLITI